MRDRPTTRRRLLAVTAGGLGTLTGCMSSGGGTDDTTTVPGGSGRATTTEARTETRPKPTTEGEPVTTETSGSGPARTDPSVLTDAFPAGAGEPFDGTLSDANGFDGSVYSDRSPNVAVGGANGLGFEPAVVRIPAGTSVTWEWTGEGGAHNVVSDDIRLNSGAPVAEKGATYRHVFEAPGQYTYFCEPHRSSGMLGGVIVESEGAYYEQGAAPLEGFLAEANGFDGRLPDHTGQDAVEIGVSDAAGNLAFDPPAIIVDAGTTITWAWSGGGGVHNVLGDGTDIDSGSPVAEAGTTYEYTVEERGVYPYYCAPHENSGMRGVVVAV